VDAARFGCRLSMSNGNWMKITLAVLVLGAFTQSALAILEA
jgi:hypothetical protein